MPGVRLVATADELVATCDGFADHDERRPWTSSTRTQIASISKQYLAVVALVLADRGVVDLDAPVGDILGVTSEQWRAVSLRHLLTHTSGMSHWGERPGFDPSLALGPDERLRLLLAAPLADSPGATWRYSSPGYIVAAAVLERAAARGYADLVRDEIIHPLRLSATTVADPADGTTARGYRDGLPVPGWSLHTMPGTGDIWTSAEDLATFLHGVHVHGSFPDRVSVLLHDADSYRRLPETLGTHLERTGYGFGHFVGTVGTQPAYFHPGDNPGYLSLAAWLPHRQRLVIVLSNDESDDVEQQLAELVRRESA